MSGLLLLSYNSKAQTMSSLETSFIIGENELQYDNLVSSTSGNLYEVCDKSMEKAYETWQGMLVQISNFAEQEDIDINGVKIWMNTFWNADGTIKNIVFYPKLNSKNIDFSTLSRLFTDFAKEYQLPYNSDVDFAHYGQATFPVFPIRVSGN